MKTLAFALCFLATAAHADPAAIVAGAAGCQYTMSIEDATALRANAQPPLNSDDEAIAAVCKMVRAVFVRIGKVGDIVVHGVPLHGVLQR